MARLGHPACAALTVQCRAVVMPPSARLYNVLDLAGMQWRCHGAVTPPSARLHYVACLVWVARAISCWQQPDQRKSQMAAGDGSGPKAGGKGCLLAASQLILCLLSLLLCGCLALGKQGGHVPSSLRLRMCHVLLWRTYFTRCLLRKPQLAVILMMTLQRYSSGHCLRPNKVVHFKVSISRQATGAWCRDVEA